MYHVPRCHAHHLGEFDDRLESRNFSIRGWQPRYSGFSIRKLPCNMYLLGNHALVLSHFKPTHARSSRPSPKDSFMDASLRP